MEQESQLIETIIQNYDLITSELASDILVLGTSKSTSRSLVLGSPQLTPQSLALVFGKLRLSEPHVAIRPISHLESLHYCFTLLRSELMMKKSVDAIISEQHLSESSMNQHEKASTNILIQLNESKQDQPQQRHQLPQGRKMQHTNKDRLNCNKIKHNNLNKHQHNKISFPGGRYKLRHR